MRSWPESTSYGVYKEEAGGYEDWSDEKWNKMFALVRKGDIDARNKIVVQCQPLVIGMARRFFGSLLPLEDLASEGNLGLMVAIDKFDPSKNVSFTVYAKWWIRVALQQASMSQGHVVYLPCNVWSDCMKALNWWSSYQTRTGRVPSPKEIADGAGVHLPVAEMSFVMRNSDQSLDQPLSDHTGRGLHEYFQFHGPSAEDQLYELEIKEVVKELLDSLPDVTAEAFRRQYGIDQQEPEPLRAVAADQGVSKQRVHQRLLAAIEKINKYPQYSKLKEVLK